MSGYRWYSPTQGTCPLTRCQALYPESSGMAGETWLGPARAILQRQALKSLYDIIYVRKERISLCPSHVQNAKSFFRLGLISLSSIRSTMLPSWGQTALTAPEMAGGSIKGGGSASCILCSVGGSTVCSLGLLGRREHSRMAYLGATVIASPSGEHNRDFHGGKQCGTVDAAAARRPGGLAPRFTNPLLTRWHREVF